MDHALIIGTKIIMPLKQIIEEKLSFELGKDLLEHEQKKESMNHKRKNGYVKLYENYKLPFFENHF